VDDEANVDLTVKHDAAAVALDRHLQVLAGVGF
jgi:hypothetical protein